MWCYLHTVLPTFSCLLDQTGTVLSIAIRRAFLQFALRYSIHHCLMHPISKTGTAAHMYQCFYNVYSLPFFTECFVLDTVAAEQNNCRVDSRMNIFKIC